MDLNAAFDAAAYVRQFDPRARLVGCDLEIACPDCGRKTFYVTVSRTLKCPLELPSSKPLLRETETAW